MIYIRDDFHFPIIGYVKPDIFTVNEMSQQSTFQLRVLSEVMNQTGYALFEMAASPNLAGSNIVNQLYYNSEKLALHSQAVAQTEVRDINVYRLYVLNEGLAEGDTIFISCIVAHLKAGNSSADALTREVMTGNALAYLETEAVPGNYLFMGDFNFYKSSEGAFQLMTGNNDPVFSFYDPVNEIGSWHANWEYSHVHTQSTHTSLGGCPSGGGMDDRFDFILMNKTLHDQADRVFYMDDSYHALGQDGMRLDGSLLDPPNNSLPAYVLDALYGMSDHLPVVMELVAYESLGISETPAERQLNVRYNNPVKDRLKLRFGHESTAEGEVIVSLHSVSGDLVFSEKIFPRGNAVVSLDVSNIPAGFYVIRLISEDRYFTGKVVVVR